MSLSPPAQPPPRVPPPIRVPPIIPKTNHALAWVAVSVPIGMGVLLTFFMLLGIGVEYGFSSLFVGVITACLPVPVLVALVLWLDRFEPEPMWLQGLGFLWGATAAVIIGGLGGALMGGIFGIVLGFDLAHAIIGAPFAEEIGKAMFLIGLMIWKRSEFDGVVDGVIYASMVGLGFAMTEDIMYLAEAMNEGVDIFAVTVVVRQLLSPYAHSLFTSMTGIGLAWSLARKNGRANYLPAVGGLALAMFLHFLWNLSATLGPMILVVYPLFMVPTFVGVLVLVFRSLKDESRMISRFLEPEVRSGLLSAAEVEMLARPKLRAQADARALARGGPTALRNRKQLHRAAIELACYRNRTFIGSCPQDFAFEMLQIEEIRRLRSMFGSAPQVEPMKTPPMTSRPDSLPPPLPRQLSCGNCGHRLPASAQFCPACGLKF